MSTQSYFGKLREADHLNSLGVGGL